MGLRRHRPRQAPKIPGAIVNLRAVCQSRAGTQLGFARARWVQREAQQCGGEFLLFEFREVGDKVLIEARLFFAADFTREAPLGSIREFLDIIKANHDVRIIELSFEDKRNALKILQEDHDATTVPST